MKFMRYDDEQWETCHTLDAHKTLIANLVKDRPTHKWINEVKRTFLESISKHEVSKRGKPWGQFCEISPCFSIYGFLERET